MLDQISAANIVFSSLSLTDTLISYQKDLCRTPAIAKSLAGGVAKRDRRKQHLHFIC